MTNVKTAKKIVYFLCFVLNLIYKKIENIFLEFWRSPNQCNKYEENIIDKKKYIDFLELEIYCYLTIRNTNNKLQISLNYFFLNVRYAKVKFDINVAILSKFIELLHRLAVNFYVFVGLVPYFCFYVGTLNSSNSFIG